MRQFSLEMFDVKVFSLKTANFFRQFMNEINQARNSFIKKVLKKCILSTVRALLNSIFKISNSAHFNEQSRLLLSLSYLCEHRFLHNLMDSLNSKSACGKDTYS